MAAIHIPDEIDSELQRVAELTGQSKESLVREALEAHLEEQRVESSKLSSDHVSRMRQSIAELDRGERRPSEEVDLFFDRWKNEITNR